MPQGVTFEKIIVDSYYIDQTTVSGVSSSTSIEKLSRCSLCYANGYDSDTVEQLQYISNRYGPVSSWTNAYRADAWNLYVRENGCLSEPAISVERTTQTQTSASTTTISIENPSNPTIPAGSRTCRPSMWHSDFHCSATTRSGARCSGDGYCRCHNVPHADECTCLVNYGSCRVRPSPSAENSAAVPSYQGSIQSTRSCTANDNCEYSVHVISVYEARSDHSFGYHPTGSASVSITVDGDSNDTRPLILVLASYEPIEWSLSIPQGVTFEKIIVGSYYIDRTTVSGISNVTSIEKLSRCSSTIQCYADGYDDDTVEQLQYISNRYGPVSSWINAYRANSWNLRIRKNGCTMEPVVSEIDSCPFVSPVTSQPPTPPSTSAQPTTAPQNPSVPSIPVGQTACNPMDSERIRDFLCSAGTRYGARCSGDGYCRCPDTPNVDECTCFVNYGSCRVRPSSSAENAAVVPSYQGSIQSTKSCTANDNCEYSVHVISIYEARNRGFRDHVPGSASVSITVDEDSNDTRPLILMLTSYEAIEWSLSVPQGVTFEKIIVDSYYIDRTTVSGVSNVTSIEKLSRCSLCYADGYDVETVEQLQYISNRYGPVSSWTNAYRANSWDLHIRKSGCTMEPVVPEIASCPFVPPVTSQPPTPPSTSAQPTTAPQNPSVPSLPVSQTACNPMDSARIRDFLCSARTRYGARCSGDGYCRCPDTPNVDECTCFVNYGSCRVRPSSSAENSTAVPSYRGSIQSTKSCTANDNCEYSVHVISVYEARSDHSFGYHPTGSASVSVTVDGDSSDTRPLILVLASYEAIEWSLSIPQGVMFEKIIVSSYYIDQTSVSGVSSLTSIEKLSHCSSTIQCYADGYDDDTVEQLQYISNRYGPVSSWTSAYRANSWNLHMRKNGCTMEPSVPEIASCPFVPPVTTTQPPSPPSTSTQPTTATFSTQNPSVPSVPGTHSSCRMMSNTENAAAVPSYQGSIQPSVSCTANDNCEYSVHVISIYEARNRGFRDHAPGSASVHITVDGNNRDTIPLILVLLSYEAVHWSLHMSIPQGITFEKVIVASYYSEQTTISGVSSLTTVERLRSCSTGLPCYANGNDDDTAEWLQLLSDRYGPISSWSSAYRANSWDLHIKRNDSTSCSLKPQSPMTSTFLDQTSTSYDQQSKATVVQKDHNTLSSFSFTYTSIALCVIGTFLIVLAIAIIAVAFVLLKIWYKRRVIQLKEQLSSQANTQQHIYSPSPSLVKTSPTNTDPKNSLESKHPPAYLDVVNA